MEIKVKFCKLILSSDMSNESASRLHWMKKRVQYAPTRGRDYYENCIIYDSFTYFVVQFHFTSLPAFLLSLFNFEFSLESTH